VARYNRPYQDGDAESINHLYESITGTRRSLPEYEWEWLETWDGPGSIWLEFDDSRRQGDQLICQYSLIPTPMSFWGETVLAGKTENCMSHLEFRGKGNYFYHEKKYFEEAKHKYQAFFTTTGNVAKGAPGKLRMKLGYRPFGVWVVFSYWLTQQALTHELISHVPERLQQWGKVSMFIAGMIARLILRLTKTNQPDSRYSFHTYSDASAPYQQFEDLWTNVASDYGVSIDRSEKYLRWRLEKNPYLAHEFVTISEGYQLLGYLVFTVQEDTCQVVDLIVSDARTDLGSQLLQRLTHISRERDYGKIKFNTSNKNKILKQVFKQAKFINYSEVFKFRKQEPAPAEIELFVYLSEGVQKEQNVWDEENWYITDMFKEGRPYTRRPIE